MSIADETGAITLGGVQYPIGFFTLDQLELLVPALGNYHTTVFGEFGAGRIVTAETIREARKVLAIALPEGTDFGTIKTNADEIFAAVDEIAKVAGLVSLGERIVTMATKAAEASTASAPTL